MKHTRLAAFAALLLLAPTLAAQELREEGEALTREIEASEIAARNVTPTTAATIPVSYTATLNGEKVQVDKDRAALLPAADEHVVMDGLVALEMCSLVVYEKNDGSDQRYVDKIARDALLAEMEKDRAAAELRPVPEPQGPPAPVPTVVTADPVIDYTLRLSRFDTDVEPTPELVVPRRAELVSTPRYSFDLAVIVPAD